MSGGRPVSVNWTRGTYVCYVEGLPRNFKWQQLKDLAREKARHGLYADIWTAPNPTGSGWIRSQRKSEAEALYDFLTEVVICGRRLKVTLVDISNPHAKPQCIGSNCVILPQLEFLDLDQRIAAVEGAFKHQRGLPVPPVPHFLPSTYQYNPAMSGGDNMSAVNHSSQATPVLQRGGAAPYGGHYRGYETPHGSSFRAVPNDPAAPNSAAYRPGTQARQGYSRGGNGTPPNGQYVRGGELGLPGVFISGVNPAATVDDVRQYFSNAGRIEDCHVHKDNATGRSKGIATVRYSSVHEAGKAIEWFHGKTWMGKKILVREDKDALPAASRRTVRRGHERSGSPLIVDGSGSEGGVTLP